MMKREANGKFYLHLSDLGTLNYNSDNERISTGSDDMKDIIVYQPPEILKASLMKPNITKQDVWALGIIAYELCTLKIPSIVKI